MIQIPQKVTFSTEFRLKKELGHMEKHGIIDEPYQTPQSS